MELVAPVEDGYLVAELAQTQSQIKPFVDIVILKSHESVPRQYSVDAAHQGSLDHIFVWHFTIFVRTHTVFEDLPH